MSRDVRRITALSTYPTVPATVLGRLVTLNADAAGCVLMRHREAKVQRIAAVPLTSDAVWLLDRGVRADLAARLAMAACGLGPTAHAALADTVRP